MSNRQKLDIVKSLTPLYMYCYHVPQGQRPSMHQTHPHLILIAGYDRYTIMYSATSPIPGFHFISMTIFIIFSHVLSVTRRGCYVLQVFSGSPIAATVLRREASVWTVLWRPGVWDDMDVPVASVSGMYYSQCLWVDQYWWCKVRPRHLVWLVCCKMGKPLYTRYCKRGKPIVL